MFDRSEIVQYFNLSIFCLNEISQHFGWILQFHQIAEKKILAIVKWCANIICNYVEIEFFVFFCFCFCWEAWRYHKLLILANVLTKYAIFVSSSCISSLVCHIWILIRKLGIRRSQKPPLSGELDYHCVSAERRQSRSTLISSSMPDRPRSKTSRLFCINMWINACWAATIWRI